MRKERLERSGLLMAGVAQRLVIAAALIAALWLAVAWALRDAAAP